MIKKKRKKSKKTLLCKKLETIAKQIVKERDHHICQRCGKQVTGTNCHASHVFPVSRSKKLGFDLLNMKVMCFHDHMNWWHKHPTESGDWFKKKFPDRYKYLCNTYNEVRIDGKITEDWLEEKIKEYKKILESYEEKPSQTLICDLPF